MCLPDAVAVKLGAYTLFCRQLLEHLPALNDATRADLRLTCSDCCQRLDAELRVFFREADSPDLQQAAGKLGEAVLARVGYFQDQNPQAADVFRSVVERARVAAATWRYQDDLERLHQLGRQLARHFYAESPWPVTLARLDVEARLTLVYGEAAERPRRQFGYRPAPLAFRRRYQDGETGESIENAILVCFAFDRDFGLYVAYPYLYIHEYVSHLFALDYRNVRFNDGWLIHAADKFLTRRGWDLGPQLIREQRNAFGETMYGALNPIPRAACSFARDFDAWLADDQCFREMTWELAAFEPREGESIFWPNQFINHLEQEFDTDRPRLRHKIEAAPGVRALFETLPPV